MSLITFAKETSTRLTSATPKYFNDLRLAFKWLAGSAAAIDVYANSHPFFVSIIEKAHVYSMCQWVIAFSLCGVIGSSLPTVDPEPAPEPKKEEKESVVPAVNYMGKVVPIAFNPSIQVASNTTLIDTTADTTPTSVTANSINTL